MQTLMMLSGGTAPFQIEAGRENGVIWEERKVAAEEWKAENKEGEDMIPG